MIINLIIIVFVLGMAVMWATYGLFSSLIHLLVVIASGALALAFWELFVYKLFMGFMPAYAWGAGLVLPFGVFILVFRVVIDQYIKGNMQFPRLADQIFGAAFGACSGILTAGLTIIGVGFLPLPTDIGGYRPYEVDSVGNVVPVEGGNLWLGVDTMAASFYTKLSAGAFGSSTPLAYYLPDLAKQSAVSRLAKFYDPGQSTVASPDAVSATGLHTYTGDAALSGVDAAVAEALSGPMTRGQLVVVPTSWKPEQPPYDSDKILRVPPTQIRLSVKTSPNEPWELLAPVAFAKQGVSGSLQFFQLNNNRMSATSLSVAADINWVFAVPAGAEPQFLLARNTRLALPTAEDHPDGAGLAEMLGQAYDPDTQTQAAEKPKTNNRGPGQEIAEDPSGYSTHKAINISQTDALPAAVSKNKAQPFNYTDDGAIISGSGIAGKGAGGRGNSVNRIQVSGSLRPLRLVIVPHTPTNSGEPTGNVQDIWLSDSNGNPHYAIAYSLHTNDGRQKIDADTSIRRNTDLPINDIRSGDTLYAYWAVPPGITIEAYHIGSAQQSIGFEVN